MLKCGTHAHFVWIEGHDRADAAKLTTPGLTLTSAAEEYVRVNFERLDYPQNIKVCVREEQFESVHIFEVEVVPVPEFYARRVRTDRPT